MAYPNSPSGTECPLGEGEYTVVDGDCVESIAFGKGHFWETIWNHPKNASLKKARDNPNILMPGDRLFVPDKVPKTEDRPTDEKHRFVRKGVPSKLRLCIKRGGEPRGKTPYQLVLDRKLFTGKTDENGWIEIAIPPDATSGRLTVGERLWDQQVFSLELGGMDPVTEPSGVQKRLYNLGFGCETTGDMDEATSTAIAMLQKSQDLESTGKLDQATVKRLQDQYGS